MPFAVTRVAARRMARVVTLSTLLLAAAARADDSVSGSFRLGERMIAPSHACALVVRAPGDPRRPAIEVVLSQGPVDAAAASEALSPHTAVINQPGIGDYVLLWIHEDGSVGMNATFATSMTQILDSTRPGLFGGGLAAVLEEHGGDEVAGRVHSPSPRKTLGGDLYEIDVTFRARVRRPPPGTVLPRGGGDPGHALEALRRAAARKDWKAMRERLGARLLATVESGPQTARERRDSALALLDAWLPRRRVTIARGTLRGDVAELDVEGESRIGRTLHLARMVREGGEWRFDQATMVGPVE